MTAEKEVKFREALNMYGEFNEERMAMRERLARATKFATERHAGHFRKGSDIPYIVHPMEVMGLLASMGADDDLMIAGVLHDVVEDTPTTIEEVRAEFGDRVAELVAGHSDDKTKSWQERKEAEISATENGSLELKMLVLADKLANIRSVYSDLCRVGEVVWDKFNQPRDKQDWFYSKMIDALASLQMNPDAMDCYWELNSIYKDVFVTFAIDVEREEIYQVNSCGEGARLTRVQPEKWQMFSGELPEGAVIINRKIAERIEDNWADESWEGWVGMTNGVVQ